MNEERIIVLIKWIMNIAVIVVVIYICITLIKTPKIRKRKDICVELKAEIWQGKIVSRTSVRGALYKLTDGTSFYLQCRIIPNFLEVGDSVYKPAGTFDMYLYKKSNPDSSIFLPCYIDCDSIMEAEDILKIRQNISDCNSQKLVVYFGVVVENFYNNNGYASKLNNGKIFQWWCEDEAKRIVTVGDSIYKRDRTLNTSVYKHANPDSLLIIECDFNCDAIK